MPGYRMMCNNTWCFCESLQVTDSGCIRTALQAIKAVWCQHYKVSAKRRGFILFEKEGILKIKNHFKADVQFPD